MDCSCNTCINECYNKPGWFILGEAEKVAEYLDISMKELFDNYLTIDWYSLDKGKAYFVLSPAVKDYKSGDMASFSGTGECIFLKDDKCIIHEVKPYECRKYTHEDTNEEVSIRHKTVARKWATKRKYLKDLLGKKLEVRDPETLHDILNMLKL